MANLFFSFFIAIFYSVAYTVVGPMMKSQIIAFDRSCILPFAVCFVISFAVSLAILHFFPKLHFKKASGRLTQICKKCGGRKMFFITWALIFVSWIPAFLVTFPGVLSYDILSQTYSAFGVININHHPVLHTWLLRVFMNLGYSVKSEYEFGLGLLSLLQMILLSYALTRLVFLLKKKGVPVVWVIITGVMSALWFMNAILAVTMIKDTLYAAFLILFVCHFTEIVTDPSEYVRDRKNFFILPVVAFFMCAFRNNGIHIYLFCFAGLTILRLKYVKKARNYVALIVAIIVPIVMFKIYSGPVFSALGIRQGEVREALCVPIQQLQRVAVNRWDELTEEQKNLMDYYLDNLKWMNPPTERAYSPFISDPAKSCFYSDNYNADPVAFWKFYLKTGKQFSKEYVVAFLSNTLGYWYPGYYEYSYVEYENYPAEEFVKPLQRKTVWNSSVVNACYESLCRSEFWRKTPLIRVFIIPAFSTWLLLFELMLARKKGYFGNVLPMFLPQIAVWGIMLLSPMSSFRYSWPFYLLLPVFFICMWGKSKNDESDEIGA